ncbi:MAG: rod-binding protein [Phenylobacterium sp.]|uniref:rod-binding protein n=1 Tax=Phenylobacterium sp. TaxID=1871053 RepID=UPI001A5EA4FD|nr:rod-binding protein [Phenylobacterium sp.]MBL8556313.1 rod-binding protein [Phenylobacterium sp.]
MADLISPATLSPSVLKPVPTLGVAGTATTLGARPDEATMRARARDAAEKFEGQFLSIMLQQMFEGVKTDGPFGGGVGEEMFRSLMTEQMGRQMTRTGGIGLADTVQREILKMQGLQ